MGKVFGIVGRVPSAPAMACTFIISGSLESEQNGQKVDLTCWKGQREEPVWHTRSPVRRLGDLFPGSRRWDSRNPGQISIRTGLARGAWGYLHPFRTDISGFSGTSILHDQVAGRWLGLSDFEHDAAYNKL